MDKFEIHKAKVSDLHALKERQEKKIKNLLERIDRTLEEYGKRVREVESFKEAFKKHPRPIMSCSRNIKKWIKNMKKPLMP